MRDGYVILSSDIIRSHLGSRGGWLLHIRAIEALSVYEARLASVQMLLPFLATVQNGIAVTDWSHHLGWVLGVEEVRGAALRPALQLSIWPYTALQHRISDLLRGIFHQIIVLFVILLLSLPLLLTKCFWRLNFVGVSHGDRFEGRVGLEGAERIVS